MSTPTHAAGAVGREDELEAENAALRKKLVDQKEYWEAYREGTLELLRDTEKAHRKTVRELRQQLRRLKEAPPSGA